MKKLLLLFLCSLIACKIFGQVPTRGNARPPLALREVSGIVKDSSDNPVIGATVKLKTTTDSAITTTNGDGIFVFKNVKSATFVLSVTSIGFRPVVRRMLNNDVLARLVLDPIILGAQSNQLATVTVKAPSITYKTDTVEYRASDYKVRPNATVDEMLKKMEGMEVGSDGSLTHQGQQVTKAKLNGKDYAGGDLATAIKNLPADIVEKIQVVDDYGDQAARTGIKDGDPQKVLNITTLPNRSVGNLARVRVGAGNDKRFESNVFAQRINGNQVVALIGNFNNTVNGVANNNQSGDGGNTSGNGAFGSSGASSSGGSGGTTTIITPAFSYRDQLSKKVQVNLNYRLLSRKSNSINNSYGQQFFNGNIPNGSNATIDFIRNSNSQNNSKAHNFTFEFEYSPDSANFLRVTPTLSYNQTSALNSSSLFETGFRHQTTLGNNNNTNTSPNFGGIIFYQHIFKKPRRNISLQVNYTKSNQQQDNEQENNILYYRDASDVILKDSLIHRNILRDNFNANLRASFTYVEPLTPASQLEFNAQMNRRSYDNKALTSNIDAAGNYLLIDSLSNIFNYAFTETRLAGNYRLNKEKFNLSLGITAVPTNLQGTRVSQGNISTNRSYFNLIPIMRFQYVWSRQQRASLNYSGSPNEPAFNQIQPVRDVSSPQNPVVGNPDLKPAFRHTLAAQYNNYIANSKVNLSANVTGTIINNQIVTNVLRIPDAYNSFKSETRFLNLDGTYYINGRYNVAKQLADRKYNLSLNGYASYRHDVSITDNIKSFTTTWQINQRFGPRINPNESIEINPYVSYDITRTFFQISNSKTDIRTTALAVDGKFYFMKNNTFTFGYNASKNFVRGIQNNITRNPFVINAFMEKEFFARRNLTVGLQVFDILKQNNFINQVTTERSVTNTLSNALSRYFMLSVRTNLQKWTGSPSRNGRQLRRRGDGSFIMP